MINVKFFMNIIIEYYFKLLAFIYVIALIFAITNLHITKLSF